MKIVIIGNGVAGVTAARTLRDQDPELEIEIYTDEGHHHYPRPQLIELLAERVPPERVVLHSEQWYRDRNINIYLETPVAGLEPARGQIVLHDGKRVGYDRLLLATGARPFVPQLPGIEQEGVLTLRKLEDALALQARAYRAKELIVIGGGLLGLEAARALHATTGVQAYVLERRGWPLSRQLDRQGGELLMHWLQEMGITIITEAQSEQILGDVHGRVRGVALADGRTIAGDLVLIATGIRANSELARQAGLEVNRGVVVDGHLRTNAPGIYAAGDVAEFDGRVYGIIPAALEQARIAALNILGQEAEYHGTVPSNTLHVAGIELFSVGEIDPPSAEPGHEEIKIQDSKRKIYKKLVFKDNRLVGAILLGTRKNAPPLARLIAEGREFPGDKRELLADDFDFKRLL